MPSYDASGELFLPLGDVIHGFVALTTILDDINARFQCKGVMADLSILYPERWAAGGDNKLEKVQEMLTGIIDIYCPPAPAYQLLNT